MGGNLLPNPRADLIDPRRATANIPVQGGTRLLNADAFVAPSADLQGNTGRNEFPGPGLFNLDVSLSRFFSVRKLGEAGRLMFRADVYNLLNHANLNNPALTIISNSDFGVARYGRTGRTTGFPAIAPLNETGRQIQLMLRIQF